MTVYRITFVYRQGRRPVYEVEPEWESPYGGVTLGWPKRFRTLERARRYVDSRKAKAARQERRRDKRSLLEVR